MKNIKHNLTLLLFITLALSGGAGFADVFESVHPTQVPSGIPYSAVQPPVEDPTLFAGKRVGILASHGVEESEIVFPYTFLVERGANVEVLTPEWAPDGIVASQFLKPTLFVKSSRTFRNAPTVTYDLLILTGGAWNAQVVRSDSDALNLIKAHYGAGRPVAAICAGTSILIDAGIAHGQHLTGSPVVAVDLRNAGAIFSDEPAVFGNHLLTSRSPNDLPEFVKGIQELLLKQ